MDWRERIEPDPDMLVGKPVVKGTRMAVEFIIGPMAQGWSEEQILQNYRHLTREDIRACLADAEELLEAGRVYPVGAWPVQILADENVPEAVIEVLLNRGHDVLGAPMALPGATDREIIARANGERRLLLTFG